VGNYDNNCVVNESYLVNNLYDLGKWILIPWLICLFWKMSLPLLMKAHA